MKAELERTGRSWRLRFAFAALVALSLAQASAAVAANGTLGYPCGEMPNPSYSRRSSIWCLRGFWDLGAHGFVRLFHRLTTDTFANALEG